MKTQQLKHARTIMLGMQNNQESFVLGNDEDLVNSEVISNYDDMEEKNSYQ